MLALSRPVLVRVAAKHAPVSFCRPLTVAVRAYKDDAAASAGKEQQQKDVQVSKPQQAAAAPVAPRAMLPMMRLPSLFNEMQREMDQMSRMFGLGPVSSMFADDPFFAQPPAMLARMELPTMRVAVDVEEDDEAFVIRADTPGIPKDALKLSVLDGTLTISGERREEKQFGASAEGEEGTSASISNTGEEGGAASKARQPLRYERSYGSFSRSFSLPPNVDVEGIKAEAQDGVLTVTIPKVPEVKPQPKEIEIK